MKEELRTFAKEFKKEAVRLTTAGGPRMTEIVSSMNIGENLLKIKNYLLMLCATSFLVNAEYSLCTLAHAAPEISSVQGSVSSNVTITIIGRSFGNTGPNVVLFDDFEGIAGQDIPLTSPKVGSWTSSRVRGYPSRKPRYHAVHHSGNTGYQIIDTTKSTASMSDAIDQQFRKVFTPTPEIFVSYWVRIPDGTCFPWYHNETCIPATFPSGGSRWKLTWLMYGEMGFGDDGTLDLCLPTWATMFAVAGNDNIASGTWWLDNTWWSWTSWNRITHWIKPNLSNPSDSTGYLWMQRVSIEKGNSVVSRNNTQIFPTNDPNKAFDRIYFPGWLGNSSFINVDPVYDDIYIAVGAGSFARVEIGNASTYSASTRLSIATPTSWSDSTIAATIRQGDFDKGETVYLYVVDATGIINSQGYPITIGKNNLLPTPTNLRILQ